MSTNKREVSRAIFKGDTNAFDLLVLSDSEVNSVTEKEHWNYLHQALVSVSLAPVPSMVRHLVARGVNVNSKDFWGNAPLHYAARIKNAEIIGILLDAGSEIDPINLEGITPLRQTLLQKPFNLKATELLLNRGANMNQKPNGGCSTKEFAHKISHGADAAIYELFEKYSDS
jgi:ankyrin repeat protein